MSEGQLQPSEAIRLLYKALSLLGVSISPKHVPQDLASLRRAHTDDALFANAVRAVAREIVVARRSPTTHGEDIEYELTGRRRSKFASIVRGPAHVRLVFRARAGGKMEILAFGGRERPQSVYLSAKRRS